MAQTIPILSRGSRGNRSSNKLGTPSPYMRRVDEPGASGIGLPVAQPLASVTGQNPLPGTPYDPGVSRQANHQQNLRERRTSSSPNFLASVANNNVMKGVQAQRGADFVTAKRAGIAAMQGQNAQFGTPETSMPKLPTTGMAMKTRTDNNQPLDPSKTRMHMVTGSPAQAAQPAETTEQHFNSELQRSNNVATQQNRGLGLPVVDGGAFKARPMNPGTPAIDSTLETHNKIVNRPTGAYGLSQDQLNQVNRDADQQAYAGAQAAKADIQTGGYYTDQVRGNSAVAADANVAQAQLVAAQAKAAAPQSSVGTPRISSPSGNIIEQLPMEEQEQAARDVVSNWRATTQPSAPTTQPTAPATQMPTMQANPSSPVQSSPMDSPLPGNGPPPARMPTLGHQGARPTQDIGDEEVTEENIEFTARQLGRSVEEVRKLLAERGYRPRSFAPPRATTGGASR
jgi:hypothetical protein